MVDDNHGVPSSRASSRSDSGRIADLAIHQPHRQGDNRNHHAYIMLTLREITAGGFGNEDPSWNARSVIGDWREAWAQEVN